MLKVWHIFFSFRVTRFELHSSGGACSGSLAPALAAIEYKNVKTDEGLAWHRINEGEAADFNRHCSTHSLDPKEERDRRWQDDGRKLSPRFPVDLLTQAS